MSVTSEGKSLRLVFVCGAERTGTTVVQRILCTDPNTVPVVGEMPLVPALLETMRSALDSFDFFYKDYFSTPDDLLTVASGAMLAMTRTIRARYPKYTTLVLKSPGFTPQVQLMQKVFPRAHCVVVRRNPHDTIGSMMKVAKRAKASGSQAFIGRMAGDVAMLSARFLSFYEPIMMAQEELPRSLMFVRYESLVQNPAAEIEKLANRLKLDLTPPSSGDSVLSSKYLQEGRNATHQPYWSDDYRKAITSKHMGTYRDMMVPEEIEQISKLTAAYQEWAGYKNPPRRVKIRKDDAKAEA